MALTVIDNGPGPRMHALVIGIGGYRHLRGGTGKPLPNLLKFGNPGQLTSPPRSALAVAAALKSANLEWVVRLGTIDLLISPAPSEPDPVGDGAPLEQATRGAIQTAFDRWWDRCNAHADNVAFFYVAGHGLEGLHQIVLASDFGESEGQPWLQAFDVDDTRKALTANRAKTQVFLVDTCRQVTTSNVEVPNAPAPPLRSPTMRQPDNCKHDLTVKATSRTREAQGPVSQPSYFASALVLGLAGGAATKNEGDWWITTGKLAERFYPLMDLTGADTNAQRLEPRATRSFQLARLLTTPPVRLQLSCRPDQATPLADLAWRQGTAPAQRRPRRAPEAWTVDVAPGLCWVSATFSGGEYVDRVDQDIVVEPPLTCDRVVVK
jgi:Caspase domain